MNLRDVTMIAIGGIERNRDDAACDIIKALAG